MPTTQPYLNTLNTQQTEATTTTEGPLLVLAGAGTGKTKVLTTRIAHLLLTEKAFPGQILAVTFTNKAAQEMKERITHLVGPPAEGLWIGTFHSIGARILRKHAERLNFTPDFTIIDTDDQIRLIKQLMAEHQIDVKTTPPKLVLSIVQGYKDKGMTPEQIQKFNNDTTYTNLYKDYQTKLLQYNACDFGDLLLHNLTLFTQHPEILTQYHHRFNYILVDEYQDTNVAQYLWLRLLAQARKNICCVGDDDQSIYGWRGAEVGNILKFEKDFPNATIIRLEQNYRSTSPILACASAVIAHNTERHGKTLWTEQNGGEKIKIKGYYNNIEEANETIDEISTLQYKGIEPEQIAILVRTGAQTRNFEEAFLTSGIPYQVIGALKFYERKEIRDVIAYIKLLLNQHNDLAFERIINTPKRGIGNTTLEQLRRTGSEHNLSLVDAAKKLIKEKGLRPQAAKALEQFIKELNSWSKERETSHHVTVIETVLEESGYLAMWENENTEEANTRLENIRELIRALNDFDTLSAFLEHVSLVTDIDQNNNQNVVSIMTLHAAKGLEFDIVFLPGWEEGLFPNQRALDENGHKALEEERRLAYVGITRAKKQLYVSFASTRRIFNKYQQSIPSRFISELPDEYTELHDNSNYSYQPSYSSSYSTQRHHIENNHDMNQDIYDNNQQGGFQKGQRIFHQKFGYGLIQNIQGEHIDIAFEKAGTKKVISRYIESV